MTSTTSSTYQWCGTTKTSLTDVEKAILLHQHEAKRTRFFGMMKESEYHEWMVKSITRMQEYSKTTHEDWATVLKGKA